MLHLTAFYGRWSERPYGKEGYRDIFKKSSSRSLVGSVLGPLLCNLSFDELLRVETEKGCTIVSYTDDTLVLSSAKDPTMAVALANIQVATVGAIGTLPDLRISGVLVVLGALMKYLGVLLDPWLSFTPHPTYVEEKVARVSRALFRLLPNVEGPSEQRRQLYAEVLYSVILYAAPARSDAMSAFQGAQRARLEDAELASARLRGVILPNWEEWMDRRYRGLSFRLTQILTGHGWIHDGGVPGLGDETENGEDLTLRGLVRAMVESGEKWTAAARFAERVMVAKESVARKRQHAGRRIAAGPESDTPTEGG
ncbi:uncharacterized protein LOC124405874 [Diprion similis]|uniref:uncharacterized protein LOC124405874 n=1 Tax=Diprion similis TaxID=362088 RepID=UPI001EF922DB|nr:uncharacterized protein LOC124405874 [Diprion similis]